MTTRPGHRRRFAPPARVSLLLAIALFGAAGVANAAVTAIVVGTELRVTGDAASNLIRLSLSADTQRVEVRDGSTLVNSVLRTAFTTIVVDGGAGGDNMVVDEVNGPFTTLHPTTLRGGDGNDVIVGGAGAETIEGGPGFDGINGGPGNDILLGGDDNDSFNWQANAFLSATDGSDTIDGGEGYDTLVVTGNTLGETYTLTNNGNRAVVSRGVIQLNTGTVERLSVHLEGGNDTFTAADDVATMTELNVDGGDGDDHIDGGGGNDILHGDAGSDVIDGGPGDDYITGDDYANSDQASDNLSGGAGNDTFQGYFGEGSDTWTGGPGVDTLRMTGTNGADTVTFLAGQMLVGPGAESHDLSTIEVVELGLGEGNDTVIGNTTRMSLVVNGSNGNDHITGGIGNDVLSGGPGDDDIEGGAGDDTITGGTGIDSVHGGPGDDVLRWSAPDWDEALDGDSGTDTLDFDGDALAVDRITVGPDGQRVSVSWTNMSVLTAHLDLGSIERLDFTTGGNDDGLNIQSGLIGLIEQITVDLGDVGDYLDVVASSPPVIADGGAGAPDRLRFDAQGQSIHLTPATISTQGVLRVTHTSFEEVTILNPAGALPAVTITSPTTSPAMSSTSSFVTLAGTVVDDGPIVLVTWASDRGGSGVATGTTAWTIPDVALQPGLNRISVSALDSTGNMTFDTIEVTVSAVTYSLAEGATGAFFDLDVLIANPTATPTPVSVTFLRQAGAPVNLSLTLAATSRATLHVDDIPGLENEGGISTVVTSTSGIPLVVERTMFWDASYYGSHGGTAVDGPGTHWLFAEGSEGFFNTFLLLANAGASASDVTLTFLREGSTPFVKTLTVPAASRVTVAAGSIPELVGRSFSTVVDASAPIIAERAMYFGTARLFDGGHESAGVAAGATSWFLAEGATGSFFTTFVLVGNPNPVAANVTFTFLTAAGQTVVRNKVVPAIGRLTVNVATEDPILASAAVSTTVTADQAVIAERAMYWPGPPSSWSEAHNSFGATTLGTKWGLSEGRVGMDHAFQTYILLANPSTTAANVQITFLRADGTTVVKTFTVLPTSRFNVAVNTAAPELQNETFGALIEVTNGVGISVERAMYSDALGQVWAAGTNALGTRLP